MGEWKAIWPIFGASNQLVGALALMVLSAYLLSRKKPVAYTLYPALFMLLTTLTALAWQIRGFWRSSHLLLASIGVALVALALFLVWENIRMLRLRRA
jgi:carbon starvation protein